MVDSHESDAYLQKNDFVAQSWILQFISQTYGTFTKIYASSYYMIVATWMEFMLIIEHQSNPTNAYYVICKCHNVTKTLVERVQQFKG